MPQGTIACGTDYSCICRRYFVPKIVDYRRPALKRSRDFNLLKKQVWAQLLTNKGENETLEYATEFCGKNMQISQTNQRYLVKILMRKKVFKTIF